MKPFFIKQLTHRWRLLLPVVVLCWVSSAWSDTLPEYGLKAGILYSFTAYTEWPAKVGETLNLCIYGQDPFGDYLDDLQGKKVNDRFLKVRRLDEQNSLESCQVVFFARSATDNLAHVLNKLKGRQVLTVADTPGAAGRGVVLNMETKENRIVFEANLTAARANGLNLSARLLRLAMDVIK